MGNRIEGALTVRIQNYHDQVRPRLTDDFGKELVPRTLRFQPYEVNTQQQAAQRVARIIGRIDNGDAKHGRHRISIAVDSGRRRSSVVNSPSVKAISRLRVENHAEP